MATDRMNEISQKLKAKERQTTAKKMADAKLVKDAQTAQHNAAYAPKQQAVPAAKTWGQMTPEERLNQSQKLQESGLTGVGLKAAAKAEGGDPMQALANATQKSINKEYSKNQVKQFGMDGIQQAKTSLAAKPKVAPINSSTPAATPPPEGGFQTEEERLQWELGNEKIKTQFYQEQDQAKGKDLNNVSSQMADFKVGFDEWKNTNQENLAKINAQIAGLGDMVGDVASGLPELEGVNLADPGLQQVLIKAATGAQTEEEKRSRIKTVLENAASSTPAQAPDQSQATALQPTQVALPVDSASPELTQNTPVVSPQQEANKQTADFYASKGPMDFASLVSSLAGTDGSTFTSADLTMQKLQLSMMTSEMAKGKIEKQEKEKKERILTQKEQYDAYFGQKRKDYSSFLTNAQDSSLRKIELKEQQITAEKADKKAELDKKTERYESFVKAQMAAAGIPLAGQAGATMLINSVSEWNNTVNDTLGQYDEALIDLHNQSIEVVDSFAAKIMEFNFSLDEKEMEITQGLNDKWDAAEDNALMSEMQVELTQAQALGDYFTETAAQKQEQEKMIYEAQKEAEKQLWEKQKFYSEKMGVMVAIDEYGQPTPMLDAEGNPMMSLDASKFTMEMDFKEREFGWKQDQFNAEFAFGQQKFGAEFGLKSDEFNFNQNKFAAEYGLKEQQYWASLNNLENITWDPKTGEYIGSGPNGNVGLGTQGIPTPAKSKYDYTIEPDAIRITGVKEGQILGRYQCGAFVNDVLGLGLGDNFDSGKMNKANSFSPDGKPMPVAGGAFFERMPKSWDPNNYGHTGIVEKVNADGSFEIIESNFEAEKLANGKRGRGKVSRTTIEVGSVRWKRMVEQGGFHNPAPAAPRGQATGIYEKFRQQAVNDGMSNEDAKKFANKQYEASSGKLTESENSSYLAYSVAKPALDRHAELYASVDPEKFTNGLNAIRTGIFGNKKITQDMIRKNIKDPKVRSAIESEFVWVMALLRKESGASIAADEYKNKADAFFPRPGNTAEEIEFKRKLREEQTKAIYVGMGPSGQRQYSEGRQNDTSGLDWESDIYGADSVVEAFTPLKGALGQVYGSIFKK